MPDVFILGAGASHYAGIPLVSGLYPALYQRFSSEEQFQIIHRLVQTYNSENDLEFFLTLLDLSITTERNIFPDYQIQELIGFRRYLADKIKEYLRDFRDDKNDVMYQFCSQKVQKDDVIISFNYDLLIEYGLFKAKKWHPLDPLAYGYEPISWRGINQHLTLIENGETVEKFHIDVQLLKLHGSINWETYGRINDEPSYDIDFKMLSFVKQNITGSGTTPKSDNYVPIIAPTYLKYFPYVCRKLWSNTFELLKQSTTIYVIGYSFPKADILSQMLGANLKPETKVVIVNPNMSFTEAKLMTAFLGIELDNKIPINKKFEEWVYCD